MSEELRTWLSQKLIQLNWSHRELARRIGLSHSIVSKTLAGERNASADFCVKVAEALGESPEKLLRLAGILPATSKDASLEELVEIARGLPSEKREEILRYARYVYHENRPTSSEE